MSHSSEVAALVAIIGLVVAATGGVAAVQLDGETPEEAEVETELHIEELTITDPFSVNDPWTMRVTTELREPRIILTARDGAGDPVQEVDVTNDSAQLHLDSADGVSDVVIEVRGDVPEIGGGAGPGMYNYGDPSFENITALTIGEVLDDRTQTVENGEIVVHRYTPDSKQARQAIDNASAAAAEADSDDARQRVDEAITFYNSGEFDDAIAAANDAEEIADSEGETRRLLLIIGGVIVALVLIAVLAYALRSKQEPANKLQ